MITLTGLALGLAGSLHCVGMCGPIALALPGQRRPSLSMVGEKLAYNFGRITTYSLLGVLAGYGGEVVVNAGFSQTLSVTSGVLMIATAIVQLVLHKNVIPQRVTEWLLGPLYRFFRGSLDRKRSGYFAHVGMGLINGLLPCGLVVSAVMGSLGAGGIIEGALFMSFFGIGTLPLMGAVSILGATLSCSIRQKLRFGTPAIAVVIGIVFILRGLSLDIPMISPVVEQGKPSCCTAKNIIK